MKRLSRALFSAVLLVSICAAFAIAAEPQTLPKEPSSATTVSDSASDIHAALKKYDTAFQARDLTVMKQMFAEDIVLYEQGAQNSGRDDVMNRHLGPELQSFQELSARYSGLRVQESSTMATVTRQFSIQAKRQNRLLFFQGCETQSWELREGRWLITHIHYSFPAR